MADQEQHAPADPGPGVVIGPCHVGSGSPYAWQQSDLPHWLRDFHASATSGARVRAALKVLAIAICATVLGLALPGFETLDYWVGMAAFLVALVVAGTM